jgi:hypothetical protein
MTPRDAERGPTDAGPGPSTPTAEEPTRRDPPPDVLDDALGSWDPDTDTDAATLLATTGERLGRDALADRLAGGTALDARTWWDHAAGPGIDRLADAGIVDDGPDGFRWIGTDAVDTGGSDG